VNKKIAEFLIRSLLERIEQSNEKTFLSSDEAAAIKLLFSKTDGSLPKGELDAPNTDQEFTPIVALSINFDDVNTDQIMCLDFGTSFSKAFACKDNGLFAEPDLIELHLDYLLDGSPNYLLPSELFIDGDDIYFGASARRRFNTVEADQTRLIDSPKQYMTLGTEVSKLSEKTLPETKDPKNRLSQRDALVIYIAHFNRLAEKALEEKNCSVNTVRRYTHPAWGKETIKANSLAMKRIVAEAIAISRAYPDEFLKSANINMVKQMLVAAEKLDESELPLNLLKGAVREATAAGCGALTATPEGKREAYVILDIGAGTTDIAGCICVHNSITDEIKVSEVETAAKAFNKAGNFLDQILLNMVHGKLPYDKNSIEYKQVNNDLRRKIRAYKETLFVDGDLLIPLVTGDNVNIALDDFMSDSRIEKFISDIQLTIQEAAFAVHPDGGTVKLVPTGGGARLSFIQKFVNNGARKESKTIQYDQVDAMPSSLKLSNPDLIEPYPQLAVAAGGSLPSLPKQVPPIPTGPTNTPKSYMRPSYKKTY